MIPQNIIELAIKGGFLNADKVVLKFAGYWFSYTDSEHVERLVMSEIVLRPDFWQALGKELGWNEAECLGMEADLTCPCKPRVEAVNGHMITIHNGSLQWKTEAHNFFDLLLTSGDTKRFWEDLLTTNTK